MTPPIEPGRPLVIRSLNGFGDVLWVLVAIARIKHTLGIPSIVVRMHRAGDARDDRALEFVRRFKCIDYAFSDRFESFQNPSVANNRLRYIPNGYNVDQSEYTLIANGHLEWTGHLKMMMPDVPCDWHVLKTGYRVEASDARRADELRRSGSLFGRRLRSHICFHLESRFANTVCGQNIGGAWSILDWAALARRIGTATDLPIYVIGSRHDDDYAQELISVLGQTRNVTDLCGKTTATEAIEILRRSAFVVSFASGIGIAAVYMGVPTVIFWNPEGRSVSPIDSYWYSDAFATNWVSPRTFADGLYYPAVYTRDRVDSVFEAIRRMLA